MKLEKDAKESFRLGDLAQVLPKGGRSIVLMVGEKDVCHSCFKSQFPQFPQFSHFFPAALQCAYLNLLNITN